MKAVLFDLDGVLVDACEWHYESLNKALKEVAGKVIDRESHVEKFNGLPTKVKLKMLGFDESETKKIEDLKQKYTIATIVEKAKIDPEKQELLQFLKSKGYKIACVTNSIRSTAELMLKSTGQIHYFDILITNEDVKNNKPHPDCYDLAIDKLGCDPEHTLCVEDSEKGIASATASRASHLWKVTGTSDVNLNNFLRFLHENFDTDGR